MTPESIQNETQPPSHSDRHKQIPNHIMKLDPLTHIQLTRNDCALAALPQTKMQLAPESCSGQLTKP